jgi:hypothetical protein
VILPVLLIQFLILGCDSTGEKRTLVVETDRSHYSIGDPVSVRIQSTRASFSYRCVTHDGEFRFPHVSMFRLGDQSVESVSGVLLGDKVWDNQPHALESCTMNDGDRFEIEIPGAETTESGPGSYVVRLELPNSVVLDDALFRNQQLSRVFSVGQ